MDSDTQHELLGRLDERTETIVKLLQGENGLVERVDRLEGLADRGRGVFWLASGGGLLGAASALLHWLKK